jgi:hypothetical protein
VQCQCSESAVTCDNLSQVMTAVADPANHLGLTLGPATAAHHFTPTWEIFDRPIALLTGRIDLCGCALSVDSEEGIDFGLNSPFCTRMEF